MPALAVDGGVTRTGGTSGGVNDPRKKRRRRRLPAPPPPVVKKRRVTAQAGTRKTQAAPRKTENKPVVRPKASASPDRGLGPIATAADRRAAERRREAARAADAAAKAAAAQKAREKQASELARQAAERRARMADEYRRNVRREVPVPSPAKRQQDVELQRDAAWEKARLAQQIALRTLQHAPDPRELRALQIDLASRDSGLDPTKRDEYTAGIYLAHAKTPEDYLALLDKAARDQHSRKGLSLNQALYNGASQGFESSVGQFNARLGRFQGQVAQLERLAEKGNKKAAAELKSLLRSKQYQDLKADYDKYFGSEPGKAGLVGEYTTRRDAIQQEHEDSWLSTMAQKVFRRPVQADELRRMYPNLTFDQIADRLQSQYQLHLTVQYFKERVDQAKTYYNSDTFKLERQYGDTRPFLQYGLDWYTATYGPNKGDPFAKGMKVLGGPAPDQPDTRTPNLSDPRVARLVIDKAVEGWQQRWIEQNGPLPVDIFGSDPRAAAFNAQRTAFKDKLYQLISGDPSTYAPGPLEDILGSVLQLPGVQSVMEGLGMPVGAIGALGKMAQVPFGSLQAPQLHLEALLEDNSVQKLHDALPLNVRDRFGSGKQDGSTVAYRGHTGKSNSIDWNDGAFRKWIAEDPQGRAFWADWTKKHPGYLGLIEPVKHNPGSLADSALGSATLGLLGFDDSQKAKDDNYQSYLDMLGQVNGDWGRGLTAINRGVDPVNSIEHFWKGLAGVTGWGQNPFSEEHGNLGNLIFQIGLDPLNKLDLSTVARAMELARARKGAEGVVATGREWWKLLGDYGFGTRKPFDDPIRAYLDAKPLNETLGTKFLKLVDATDGKGNLLPEVKMSLEDTFRKIVDEPDEARMLGRAKRWVREQFDGRKIDEGQVQSAAERLVNDALKAKGLKTLTEGEWERLNRAARDAIEEPKVRRAAKEADDAADAVEKPARQAATETRRRRAAGRSPYESSNDFVNPPAPGEAPRGALRPGDFRAPEPSAVSHGHFIKRYGRDIDRAPSYMLSVGADARHAQDIIAIADRFARENNLGLRWARSPETLRRGGPVVELWGASDSTMLRVGRDFDKALADARLGRLPEPGLRAHGRVIYEHSGTLKGDVFRRASVLDSGLERANARLDEFGSTIADLQNRLEAAVGNDPVEAGRLSRQRSDALRQRDTYLKVRDQMQEARDRLFGGGRPVRETPAEAARLDWVASEFSRDRAFLRIERDRLVRAGAPERDIRRIDEAIAGVDIAARDSLGVRHMADVVGKRYRADAAPYVRSKTVAVVHPDASTMHVVGAQDMHAQVAAREVRDIPYSHRWMDAPDMKAKARALDPVAFDASGLPRDVQSALDGMDWWSQLAILMQYQGDDAVRAVLHDVAADFARQLGHDVPDKDTLLLLEDVFLSRRRSVVGWDEYRAADALVAPEIRKVRGFKASDTIDGPVPEWMRGLPDDLPEDVVPGPRITTDYDTRLKVAQIRALNGSGIDHVTYDEIRTVGRNHLEREFRAEAVRNEAARRVAEEGGDYADHFRAARDEMKQVLAERQLRKFVYQSGPGLRPEQYWREFEAAAKADDLVPNPPTRPLTPLQRRFLNRSMADKLGVAAGDREAIRAGLKRYAPPFDSKQGARDWLVENGFWSPRTAEDIRAGRKVWSVDDEQAFWRNRFDDVPDWVKEDNFTVREPDGSTHLTEMFHNRQDYRDFTRTTGYDSAFERTAHELPDPKHTAAYGDEALGLEPERSLTERRRWFIERYGKRVSADGETLDAIPWLMDPTTEEWTRYVGNRGMQAVDRRYMPVERVEPFKRAVEKAVQKRLDRINDGLLDGGIDVIPQENLRLALDVTDELLASQEWRSVFERRGALGRAFGYVGTVMRLNTVLNPAFPIMNLLDAAPVIGPKRWLLRLGNRGVAYGKVSERAMDVFKTVDDLPGAARQGMWVIRDQNVWSRIRNADSLLGGLKEIPAAAYDAPFALSAIGENALKVDFARRIFDTRFDDLVRDGVSEEAATDLARVAVFERLNHFFPSLADAPIWQRALNDLIPFLSYNWNIAKLYAGELLIHPQFMRYASILGDMLEDANRNVWQSEHPGLPFPSDRQARQFVFYVDGKAYALDLTSMSDVTRGMNVIPFVLGQDQTVGDVLSKFLRVPHPWQMAVYDWATGQNEPWSNDKATVGSWFWPADLWDQLSTMLADGTLQDSEAVALFSKMFFFAEPKELDIYQSLNAAYFALPDGEPKRQFLDWAKSRNWDMVTHWKATSQTPWKVFLKNDTDVTWYDVHGEDAGAQVKADRDGLHDLQGYYDDKLGDLLRAGITPDDPRYRDLARERRAAILQYRMDHPLLISEQAWYMSPGDLAKSWGDWAVDREVDQYFSLDDQKPTRDQFKTDEEYQQAVETFYDQKALWLDGHPEVKERLVSQGDPVRDAIQHQRDHMFEVLDRVAARNKEIAAATASGDYDRADALRLQNELDYMDINRPTQVEYYPPPISEKWVDALGPEGAADPKRVAYANDRMPITVSLPGMTDAKWRNASPQERAEMAGNYWYATELGKVFDKIDGKPNAGALFYEEIKKNPSLFREYLRRNPGKEHNLALNGRYLSLVDGAVKSGNWKTFFGALSKDPELAKRWLLGNGALQPGAPIQRDVEHKLYRLLDRVNRTGNTDLFFDLIGKDKQFRDAYFSGSKDRKKNYEDSGRYARMMGDIIHRATKSGDWSIFWDALDSNKWLREHYFANHPGKRASYEANKRYFNEMGALIKRVKKAGNWDIFWDTLNKNAWLRNQYYAHNPGKQREFEQNNRYTSFIGDLVRRSRKSGNWQIFYDGLRGHPDMLKIYFHNNPGKRAEWQQHDQYSQYMGNWVGLLKAKKYDAAQRYFDSLPGWAKQQYRKNHPASSHSSAYAAAMQRWVGMFEKGDSAGAMRYFNNLPKAIQDRYFSTHPGKRQEFARNDQYVRAMGRWVGLLDAKKYDQAQRFFDGLPNWVQQRYFDGHPQARDGGAKSGPTKGQQYYKALGGWVDLLKAKRFDEAERYFDGLPQWMQDRYHKAHPSSGAVGGQSHRSADPKTQQYLDAMKNWVSYFDKGDSAGASTFFDALPDWIKERYWTAHPEKRDFTANGAMFSKLSEMFQLDLGAQGQYLASNPDLRQWIASTSGGNEEVRRSMILQVYQNLPKDAWLRRVFQERYPEVFSAEAKAERQDYKVQRTLREHPELQAGYQYYLQQILTTYLESAKHSALPPKQLTKVQRAAWDKTKRRRMRNRTREWELPRLPSNPPGMENVENFLNMA